MSERDAYLQCVRDFVIEIRLLAHRGETDRIWEISEDLEYLIDCLVRGDLETAKTVVNKICLGSGLMHVEQKLKERL